MQIAYLREFVTAAKIGNFTKAAHVLNMAQPVLSKHIASVEKEMGCKLFDRATNPATLTQQGQVLLEDIQALLVSYDATVRKMRSLGHARPSTVRVVSHIGCRHDDDLISRATAALSRSRPLASVESHNAAVVSPVADVMEGTADVAVVADKGLPISNLAESFLFEEPLRAVVRKGHRLSGRTSIEPADLSGETIWCSYAAPVARHYLAIKDLLEARGTRARFSEIPFHGSPSAIDLTFKEGAYVDGAGVITRSLSLLALVNDYDVIPVSGDAHLVHRALFRERETDESVMAFVDALTNAAHNTDMSIYWTL